MRKRALIITGCALIATLALTACGGAKKNVSQNESEATPKDEMKAFAYATQDEKLVMSEGEDKQDYYVISTEELDWEDLDLSEFGDEFCDLSGRWDHFNEETGTFDWEVKDIFTNVVLVSVEEKFSEEDLKALMEENNLELVYDYENFSMYAFKCLDATDDESLETVMKALEANENILTVEKDGICTLD